MDQHISRVILPVARMGPGGAIMPLGTCFAVSQRLFATAAHVTGPSDTDLLVLSSKVDAISNYQDTTDTSANGIRAKLYRYDPIRDVAIIEIPEGNQFTFPYILTGADAANVGSSVHSFGFPHSEFGRVVLTMHSSIVGARVLLGNSAVKSKHMVLNTQARPGQSGGPVFLGETNTVCAMLVGGFSPSPGGGISLGGIDPHTLHQTTHAVSAEYIRGLL